MKIIHQIFHNWTSNEITVLKKYGINLEPGYQKIFLDEDEIYQELKPILDKWGVLDMASTEFSGKDFSVSTSFMFYPAWQTGYPQPEDDFKYINTTYDTSNYCSKCGLGLIQKESFRFKKEPKWGKKKTLMLNWVFDEIFVKDDIYEKIFMPLNIDYKPVFLYKKETIIESVVQLIIPEAIEPLNLKNCPFLLCEACGRKKYFPMTRGFFPAFLSDYLPNTFVKSQEYYGSGASASKWMFLPKEIRDLLLINKVNMVYVPVSSE
ncbi:hypothetical protein [Pseudanabaena sp. PCC 6802]|uniref:hypothetical protein n=1 Tax=Pseudanabaena sp. PCC 6802 TaxID=118173 RepID=UPI000346DABB|nr:hypothetical protein [Pseudanabaena sp. PCC 6802]